MASNQRHIGVGVVGAGQFAKEFIGLFKMHPYTRQVYITDLIPERSRALAREYGVEVMDSFEDMLASDQVDSIAIFVQRHLHGSLALKALEAGKNVYSAVPMGTSIEECEKIIRMVEKTRKIYMMGETCYYFPCACFCREKHRAGEFGRFVYLASQYYHDIAGFDFQYTAGEHWRKEAGIPPMYYPTHSFGMAVSASGSYVTSLSAYGYRDQEEDGIFGEGNNYWDNPFSNVASLCRLANGGMARVSEFRRIGLYKPSSYISAFYGTKGGYEYSNAQHLMEKKLYPDKEDVALLDVSDLVNPSEMTKNKHLPNYMELVANNNWTSASTAPIQPVHRLPEEYRALKNGHMGTHQFLTDDFLRAVHTGKLPPCNAWYAARGNIPGLVAHESAMKGGAQLEVPDFGPPPADWPMLYEEEQEP